MAQIDIGKLNPTWKSAYNNSTAYVVDDMVSYQNQSYICKLASTGNVPTNTTYWDLIAAKGTDADLAAISGTVQGDLYYNNGSAIARLAPGTSGQVLQTGGSGANPSWGTVSSDFVKISSTAVGNVQTVNVDGCFNSTYNTYKIFCRDMKGGDSSDGNFEFRLRDNSGNMSSGAWWTANFNAYRQVSANNLTGGGNWGNTNLNFGGWNIPDTDTESGKASYNLELTLWNANSTVNYKNITWDIQGWEQGNTYTVYSGGSAVFHNTTAATGMQFYKTSGSFATTGKITVYGLKE